MKTVRVSASDSAWVKLEFAEKPCANPECKILTEWWFINGVIVNTLCRTCATLIQPLQESPYFVQAEYEFQQAKAKEIERIDRLRFGGDYFPE